METQTLDYWINLAKSIAITAHAGQFRNDLKTPYIKHPEMVAAKVEPRLKPIAWLHDAVEDSNGVVTLQTLIDAGFPSYITDGVDLITHRQNEPNMVYWRKMLGHPDVVIVKIADITTNLSDDPTPLSREKYARALKLFADAGYQI